LTQPCSFPQRVFRGANGTEILPTGNDMMRRSALLLVESSRQVLPAYAHSGNAWTLITLNGDVLREQIMRQKAPALVSPSDQTMPATYDELEL
jgi:hypothetical protein